MMQNVINRLHNSFALKDLGDFYLFLYIKATRDDTSLFLTQTKYIEELLKRSNMFSAKACPTPAVLSNNLSTGEWEELKDPTPY